MFKFGTDLSGLGQVPIMRFCENGNETQFYIKKGGFIE